MLSAVWILLSARAHREQSFRVDIYGHEVKGVFFPLVFEMMAKEEFVVKTCWWSVRLRREARGR